MGRGPGGSVQTHRESVAYFMDRAEQVLDCVIARRADVATLGNTFNITPDGFDPATGRPLSRIGWERPPEAEIEQAVARCRPLFLNDDACFHARMTKALIYLTREAPAAVTKLVNDCKQVWAGLPGATRWSVMIADGDTVGANLTDRQIQEAWFNGYVVHHKTESRAIIRLVGEEQRYQAGLAWISDVITLTTNTRNLIGALDEAKLLKP